MNEKFEDLTVVLMKFQVLWETMWFLLVHNYRFWRRQGLAKLLLSNGSVQSKKRTFSSYLYISED
jgi:hypothetical protein